MQAQKEECRRSEINVKSVPQNKTRPVCILPPHEKVDIIILRNVTETATDHFLHSELLVVVILRMSVGLLLLEMLELGFFKRNISK